MRGDAGHFSSLRRVSPTTYALAQDPGRDTTLGEDGFDTLHAADGESEPAALPAFTAAVKGGFSESVLF
jgi:hypothetical protein